MTTCEWQRWETEDNIADLPLQFNGFCGYTFVCRDGLLLPGSFDSLCFCVHKYVGAFYCIPVPHWAVTFAMDLNQEK